MSNQFNKKYMDPMTSKNMRKLFIFTSVFILTLVMWSTVEVGARDVNPTNGLNFLHTDYTLTSSGDDYNIYELEFIKADGTVMDIQDAFTYMDFYGDYDLLFSMPYGLTNSWIAYDTTAINADYNIYGIWFVWGGTEATSYFTFIQEDGTISDGYTLDSIPTEFKIINIVDNTPSETSYYEGYDEGYTSGQNAMYLNGSEEYGFAYTDAYDFWQGVDYLRDNGSTYIGESLTDSWDYKQGLNDLYDDGSGVYADTYDFITVNESYDFQAGLTTGRNLNVNAGVTTFMTDFDEWIVPAIVIVILLGGFSSILLFKMKRGD